MSGQAATTDSSTSYTNWDCCECHCGRNQIEGKGDFKWVAKEPEYCINTENCGHKRCNNCKRLGADEERNNRGGYGLSGDPLPAEMQGQSRPPRNANETVNGS